MREREKKIIRPLKSTDPKEEREGQISETTGPSRARSLHSAEGRERKRNYERLKMRTVDMRNS